MVRTGDLRREDGVLDLLAAEDDETILAAGGGRAAARQDRPRSARDAYIAILALLRGSFSNSGLDAAGAIGGRQQECRQHAAEVRA